MAMKYFNLWGLMHSGLPAENYAIKTGIHPKDSTLKNIETMEKQLKAMGAYFNFDSEIITCNEDYYKWTQWLFLKLYEKGLAYRKKAQVNFCPSCNTVLANEQVIEGLCERCSSEVEKKELVQWFFKITEYAEELLEKLDTLDWPEKTKKIQKNWIGKSVGSTATFKVDGKDLRFDVFSTRIDTLFGVTYVVVAPEHEIVDSLVTKDKEAEVQEYIKASKKVTEIDRLSETREKTGVFTGSYAINPITNEKVPIWIADYVLSTYGTGCVMAVPAHDERDFQFAKKYNLQVKQVIAPMFYGKGNDKLKSDREMIKRQNVACFIKHPDEEKYAVIDWSNSTGWKSIPGGGIEKGETVLDAAIRETKEETGYYDIKNVKEILGINELKLYASHKDVNRHAIHYPVIVELASLKKVEIAEEENKIHTFKWINKEELYDFVNTENQKYMVELFMNGGKALTDYGVLVNSGDFDDLETEQAKVKITEKLIELSLGNFKTTYRLRDWLVSRQRYWGAPIPIIHCDKCGAIPVKEEDLPVRLPYDVEFKPDGESPLAKCQEFVNTKCYICGNDAKRDVDTLDTFVCSSWYQFRYPDNKNSNEIFNTEYINKMLPVDKYVGGAEHAAMHLLYARFITKVLRDIGLVKCDEPFKSLIHQGLILGPDGNKMSKSKGNVISPDEYIEKYGSDVFRMYLMFAFSYTEGGPWSNDGIDSMAKFVSRLERILEKINEYKENKITEIGKDEKELLYVFNNSLKCIKADMEIFQFNTAIARIMEVVNSMYKYDSIENKNTELLKEIAVNLIKIIAPFMPHFAEEKWELYNKEFSVFNNTFPEYEEKYLQKDEIEMAVIIKGNVKFKLEVSKDLSVKEIEDAVKKDVRLEKYIRIEDIKKIIVVPGKIINIVV